MFVSILRLGLSTTFQVPGRFGGGLGTGVDVGAMVGLGVGVFFGAASTDDVPLISMNTIRPRLKIEATMSDSLSREGFRKFIGDPPERDWAPAERGFAFYSPLLRNLAIGSPKN
jgi:hypothetical protein